MPYVATPPAVVAKMLEIAQVTKDDVVYDLGSGDGRIVIMAAQRFGARGVGVEIDPQLVWKHKTTPNGPAWPIGCNFSYKICLRRTSGRDRGDSVPDAVCQPELRLKLWRELQPGTRVVSHDFSMGDWQPEQVVESAGV